MDYEHNFLSKFLKAYSKGQKQVKQYISKREQLILDLAKFKEDLDAMSGDESYDKKQLMDSKDFESATSAMTRVAIHIQRKKKLRERAKELFKDDQFLLDRANEELDNSNDKRNTKTFENAIIDFKNDILKEDGKTKEMLLSIKKFLRYNTLSDTNNTLKEIEERQKKYREDVPKEFSKVETNPYLLEKVSHAQIKEILGDYEPSHLPMEDDNCFLKTILNNYQKFLEEEEAKEKKIYDFFTKMLPEILELELRYPSLFDDSYGRKEIETIYDIHDKKLIGVYPSGDLFLDLNMSYRYGTVYPIKEYKLYRYGGKIKTDYLLFKIFENKEDFEEYNKGVVMLYSLYQQVNPLLQQLGLPDKKPLINSLYEYYKKNGS